MPDRTELDPARWQAARELFDQLVDLAPARREQRLAEAARADPEVHREVERLLAADAAADALLGRIDEALSPPAAPHAEAEDPLVMVGRDVAHFRVIEPIASGGMGVVYRAEDRQLRREIALKFPLPHLFADDRARRRFLREGRAAGALDHPNVCAVYELGETDDGHLYIAMPLCAGETLKARLARDGKLPVAVAVGIAQSIARGLGAAHAAGVVHRDVKPGNVMLLPDGGLKVLDFGLAFAHFIDTSVSRTSAGTAAYMAPEQLLGESVDARADLWALGVVLYEMLAGRLPFVGAHQAAVNYAVMHEDPVPLASVCPDLPRALVAVVDQLLLKNPARRPASAAEVDAALDAALADPSARPPRRAATRRYRPRRRTIALAAGAFLAAGAAGVVLVLLPRMNGTTTPRSTAAQPPTANAEAYRYYLRGREYERRTGSPEKFESARQLYRRALALDPTFALAHARLSIVLMSMSGSRSVKDRHLLWSQARAEAETALRAQPTLGEAHLALGHVWASEQQDDSALVEFRRAIAAIPDSAEAHLAMGSFLRGNGRWEEAVVFLERAVHLDSTDVGPLRILALTQSSLGRYQAAIATWNRVLPLTPDDHDGALIRGWVFWRKLGTTDSLAAVLRSLPLAWDDDGHASWARYNVARIEGHPIDALAAATAMRHDTAWDGFYFRPRALMQAQAYADMGDQRRARDLFRRARAQIAQALSARPSSGTLHAALGLTYAGLGQRTLAALEADTTMAIGGAPAAVTPYANAMTAEAAEIHLRIGDVNGALALLEHLLTIHAGREVSVASLRNDPLWDPLRADPRFEQMLRRHATP